MGKGGVQYQKQVSVTVNGFSEPLNSINSPEVGVNLLKKIKNQTSVTQKDVKILEEYLNSMISPIGNTANPTYEEVPTLTINYEKLCKDTENHDNLSNDFLRKISGNKKLRPLLKHPVLSFLIHYKQLYINGWFWLYFIFYCICYLPYGYIIYADTSERSEKLYNQSFNESSGNDTEITQPGFEGSRTQFAFSAIAVSLNFVFLILEIWRFVFVLMSIKSKYFFRKCIISIMLRLAVSILLFIVLFCTSGSVCKENSHQLKAFYIFLVTLDFFQVIGTHPWLALHKKILYKACLSLFKLYVTYFGLLIGLAVSLHVLFKSDIAENVFTGHPFSAFLEVLITLTKGFDVSKYKSEQVAQSTLLIFIFIMIMAIFNLSIGFAFVNVEKIKKNRFLYGNLARLESVTFWESYFSFSFVKKYNSSQKEKFFPKVVIKSDGSVETTFKFAGCNEIKRPKEGRMDTDKNFFLKFINLIFTMNDRNRMNKIIEQAREIAQQKDDAILLARY